MAVIFDEVVSEVTGPVEPALGQGENDGEAAEPRRSVPEDVLREWQRHQADFWRRRARLEAD